MKFLELLKSSMRLIKAIAAGEAPTAAEAADGLEAFNLMLGEWHNDGLLSLIERQSFVTSAGNSSYVIGSGQTWDGNKPLKIISAVCKNSNGDEYVLRVIGDTEYNEIYDKDAQGRPSVLYYLPGSATGTIYLNDVPDGIYTITLVSQKAFTPIASITTTLDFPDGYLSAFKYALAVEIAPEYEKEPSPFIMRQAEKKKALIKSSNTRKSNRIKFPRVTSGGRHGIYNYKNGCTR